MNTAIATSHVVSKPVPAPSVSRAAQWLVDGLQLWCQAPVALLLLSLLPLTFEGVLQTIPLVGVLLSKVAVTIVSAWVLLMVDRKATARAFLPVASARALRVVLPGVLAAAVVGLALFTFQMLVCAAIAGPDQAWALATGRTDAVHMPHWQIGLVLGSGAFPGTLFLFLLLAGWPARKALRATLRMALHAWRPLAAFAIASAMAIAMLPSAPALLLLFLPIELCCGYVIYMDIHAQNA